MWFCFRYSKAPSLPTMAASRLSGSKVIGELSFSTRQEEFCSLYLKQKRDLIIISQTASQNQSQKFLINIPFFTIDPFVCLFKELLFGLFVMNVVAQGFCACTATPFTNLMSLSAWTPCLVPPFPKTSYDSWNKSVIV